MRLSASEKARLPTTSMLRQIGQLCGHVSSPCSIARNCCNIGRADTEAKINTSIYGEGSPSLGRGGGLGGGGGLDPPDVRLEGLYVSAEVQGLDILRLGFQVPAYKAMLQPFLI